MAFTAYFFTFPKKPNSTQQPALTDGVQAQIELKGPTTVTTPDIWISGIPGPYIFNYAYIPEFSRYYWVEAWRWEAGRWLASLKVDVLASFKIAIGNSNQYVLRSAGRADPMIADNLYPMTNEFTTSGNLVNVTRNMTFRYQDGVFIVGIIAKGATNLGSVTYYAMTYTQFAVFRNAMFSDVSWAGTITDISADLLKTLVNPFDYVVSCKWCPCTDYNFLFDTEVSTIPVGFWSFTCTARQMSSVVVPVLQHIFTVDLTQFAIHPQADLIGGFLNYEPFTKYKMELAPYGVIELPAEVRNAGFTCVENIDLISGEAVLNIYSGPQTYFINPLKVVKTDMFVNIQIAQVKSGDIKDAAVGIGASAVGDVITNFLQEGPIKAAATGITSAIHNTTQVIKVSPDNGGFARFAQYGGFNLRLIQQFNRIATPDPTHLGYALCAPVDINELVGYVKCAHPEVATIGTDPEQQEIAAFLENGFFYE